MASWGLFPRFGTSRKEYPELNCEVIVEFSVIVRLFFTLQPLAEAVADLLPFQFLGKPIRNPIGLAAGFDKNGEAIRSLAEMSGFGIIEIGSITPIPQKGNHRPRVFRLKEDEGIISRSGFNNDGVGKVQQRVKEARSDWMDDFAMFGVNLGNNMLTDDAKLLLMYVKRTIDVMALESRPKVLLKIPPDLTEEEKKNIAKIILDSKYGIDALVVSSATTNRPNTLKSENKAEAGELSGAPLRHISTECVREMYRLTEGRVPIVGCGGVLSGADAYEKIRAGASVVQLYSAIAFYGFPVVGKMKRELVELLLRDGYTNVSQAVGADQRV
ncbi:dihydroorotate oxidase [Necator americanus]|uniref:Dihydroorotate dehydrogenase (quinone), mitochondrial n=1 Tax=Necator americanus TaxID=51031 RepID=W2SQ95_NECAM|nr:dihydroorotate oxidase [Necator americanus]ETN70857.1 dihydroorotate oxidase [Necator americanus]